jgi:phosphatidylglycerol---prolipoprotein diacylglyceryl transferase
MTELLAAFTYVPHQRWWRVSPHGVGTALGFFLGAWLMARRAEPKGIPRPEVYNAVTWGAIGAIIGARGFYVLAHLDSYRTIVDALKVWEGGLTMFGGFIGGLVLGLGYLRRKKFSIVTALDAAAPGFVVGVLIGRLGDIAIADHLGERTTLPFGYRIPNAPLAPGYGPPYYTPGAVVHHTAVYDFIGALVLFGFLYWLERRKPRTGTLFAAFSIWYGLQRLLIDFTRNRTIIESSYFGLSGSQWAGLGFAVFGVYLLSRIRRSAPTEVPVPVPTPVAPAWPPPQVPAPADAPPVPPPQPAVSVPPSPAPPPAPIFDPSVPARPPEPAPSVPEGPPEPAPRPFEPAVEPTPAEAPDDPRPVPSPQPYEPPAPFTEPERPPEDGDSDEGEPPPSAPSS